MLYSNLVPFTTIFKIIERALWILFHQRCGGTAFRGHHCFLLKHFYSILIFVVSKLGHCLSTITKNDIVFCFYLFFFLIHVAYQCHLLPFITVPRPVSPSPHYWHPYTGTSLFWELAFSSLILSIIYFKLFHLAKVTKW